MANAQYHISLLSKPMSKACGEGQISRYQAPVYVYTNGTAMFSSGDNENSLVSHNFYCIDRLLADAGSQEKLTILQGPYAFVCEDLPQSDEGSEAERRQKCADSNDLDLCVPKCCPEGEIFEVTSFICVLASNESLVYQPVVKMTSGSLNMEHKLKLVVENFYVKHMHNTLCRENYKMLNLTYDVSLLTSGDLVVKDFNNNLAEYFSHGYCIDNFQDGDDVVVSGFVCRNVEPKIVAISDLDDLKGSCGDEDLVAFNKRLRTAYTLCGLFSLVFLVITMFVYITLPSLKNLHGKIVLSNVTSVLLTTVLLVLIYNVHKNDLGLEFVILVPASICHGLGYRYYYPQGRLTLDMS